MGSGSGWPGAEADVALLPGGRIVKRGAEDSLATEDGVGGGAATGDGAGCAVEAAAASADLSVNFAAAGAAPLSDGTGMLCWQAGQATVCPAHSAGASMA